MKEQEKQLLLKDLCARLPYGVFIETKSIPRRLFAMDLACDKLPRPYLRPMDSITEEEKGRAAMLLLGGISYKNADGSYYTICHDPNLGEVYQDFDFEYFSKGFYGVDNVDFLIEHHLDFRGLIEKCLALAATEGMYNIK